MSRILVVDDEQAICWGLEKLGKSMGHDVQTAASAEQGLRLAAERRADLLVLDVRLPGMDGLTAIAQFRPLLGDAPIIVITAFGALDIAVKAVNLGAFEYIVKPFDLADVRAAIERGLRSAQEVQPVAAPEEPLGDMVGAAPATQELFKQIALVAASDANVLVHGESGVGKELAALAIHRYSPRSAARFVPVNVAALSPTLAESELFGHVDGAFTGASRSRDGLLVQANGGTLFLDEVADIPLPIQVKLLRAIEQQEVLPVGADSPTASSFRIVAATHQDLKARVQKGAFRHDLYYRLCAFEITIPPLRQRVEDIPLLATHFASQVASNPLSLAEDTLSALKQRTWYGNVRELRNAIEHAAVLARTGVVLPEHLPAPQPRLDRSGDAKPLSLAQASHSRSQQLLNDPDKAGEVYDTLLREVEAPLLGNAMEMYDNECAPAARALGMHRTTLKKKLEQHDLQAEPQDD